MGKAKLTTTERKEFDLRTADRDTLVAIIMQQQAIIDQLEKRIAQLEGPAKSKARAGCLV